MAISFKAPEPQELRPRITVDGSRCLLCDEHVLDPATKCLSDEERKGQRGVETPAFDRDDRLPRDAERACEVGLSPFAIESSFGDVVPHLTAR